jgi:hypothetical protein
MKNTSKSKNIIIAVGLFVVGFITYGVYHNWREIKYVATLLFTTLPHTDVTSFSIISSATDPAIKTFDSPNWIYVNRNIVVERKPELPPDRRELLLWLPGTGGKGDRQAAFCNLAADLGYHAITLVYPNKIPAAICRDDSDPNAFENFRMAIIQGGRTKHISVEKSESIENRLVKLLLFLKVKRPEENWGQFLNDDGTIKWEAVAVGGQSQGGGHAALVAIKHRIARVICAASPKDYSKKLDAPAAWYGDESATPKVCFFTFNHRQDPQACTPQQLLENLKALGLDACGPPIDVATVDFPYHHTRILTTSYPEANTPSENSIEGLIVHGSVVADTNADHWKQVWTYMLTEPTP